MKDNKPKKKSSLRKSPNSFKGAATIARRRAFKAGLPVVIMENGIIYYEYRDGTRRKAQKTVAKSKVV